MNIEQEVREMLSSKVRQAPGLEEPPQPVLRRARVRRVRNEIGIAAAMVVIAIGSFSVVRTLGTAEIQPDAPGVVPWKSLPANEGANVPCRASDLVFSADAGPGSSLQFRPKSSDVYCNVGDFHLDLLAASGQPLKAFVRKANTFSSPYVQNTRQLTLALFEWQNGCAPTTDPIRFVVTLGGDRGRMEATATNAGDISCTGSRTNTGLTLNATGSRSLFEGGAPMSELRARLSAVPKQDVRAGTLLRFVVTLTNPTDKPIALDPCPAINIQIEPNILGASSALNCQDAPEVITAGKSVSFAMEAQLPGNVYERAHIEWSLGSFGSEFARVDSTPFWVH
jgi:hypothetical protein